MKFSLTGSEYVPSDAKEVLQNLLEVEMKYQKLQNYKAVVRHDAPNLHVVNRIDHLKQVSDTLAALLETAVKQNQKLIIETVVQVHLAE